MMYGGNLDKYVGPLTSPKQMEFVTHRNKAPETSCRCLRPRPEATGLMYELVDNYDGRQYIVRADGKPYDVLRHSEKCKEIIDRMTTAQMVKHYGWDTFGRTPMATARRSPAARRAEPEPAPRRAESEPRPTPDEVMQELIKI